MSNPGYILVVDDLSTNRLKISLSLKQQGYTIAEAESGRRALELLRAEPFDLVLLDILMPEMDGYEVLAQMKRDRALRAVPVIVLSALDEMENVPRSLALGAEDFLPKSFDPAVLREKVEKSIEKKRQRDQAS